MKPWLPNPCEDVDLSDDDASWTSEAKATELRLRLQFRLRFVGVVVVVAPIGRVDLNNKSKS